MHTTEYKDTTMAVPDVYCMHYDGDPRGGRVIISKWVDEHYHSSSPAAHPEWEIEIPFDVLAAFLADRVRNFRIEVLEQQTTEEVLRYE